MIFPHPHLVTSSNYTQSFQAAEEQKDPLDTYKIHRRDVVGMCTSTHSATAGLYIRVL